MVAEVAVTPVTQADSICGGAAWAGVAIPPNAAPRTRTRVSSMCRCRDTPLSRLPDAKQARSERGAGSPPTMFLGLVPLPLPRLALAAVGDQGGESDDLAVLGSEFGGCALRFAANVFGVDQQRFLAALHRQGELGHRRVRHHFEGVADPVLLVGVDAAVEIDVDLAVERRYQIRQGVA